MKVAEKARIKDGKGDAQWGTGRSRRSPFRALYESGPSKARQIYSEKDIHAGGRCASEHLRTDLRRASATVAASALTMGTLGGNGTVSFIYALRGSIAKWRGDAREWRNGPAQGKESGWYPSWISRNRPILLRSVHRFFLLIERSIPLACLGATWSRFAYMFAYAASRPALAPAAPLLVYWIPSYLLILNVRQSTF